MPLIYTVEEVEEVGVKKQTYEGFVCASALCLDHGCNFINIKPSLRPPEAKYLGIVTWEDTVNLYWLENNDMAVEEIKRLWRMNPGVDVDVFVFQESN